MLAAGPVAGLTAHLGEAHSLGALGEAAGVAKARDVAFSLVDASPGLSDHPLLRAELDLLLDEAEADYLLRS